LLNFFAFMLIPQARCRWRRLIYASADPRRAEDRRSPSPDPPDSQMAIYTIKLLAR